jgi:hypothetical protein
MIFQPCDCFHCRRGAQQVIFPIVLNNTVEYWLDIPKNASTSIKVKFDLDGKPSVPKEYYSMFAASGIKPYAVYRDPMVRFASLLQHYLTRSGPYGRYNRGEKFFWNHMNLKIEELSIEERMEIMFDNLTKLNGFYYVHHWFPQTYWLPKEFQEYKWVAMEDVQKVFDIGNTNPGSGKITTDMLTKRMKDFVAIEYRNDYEYFTSKGLL